MKKNVILIIEIILVLLIVYGDAIGLLPISQTIYLLPLIWIVLRVKKESFASIGFSIQNINFKQTIVIGVVIGIVLELIATYFTTPAISQYFNTEPDLSEFSDLKGNAVLLIVYLLLSWGLAAFGEEICFRGYLMNRLAGLFNNNNVGWIIGLILSSILFGWGHTEQGISGWVQEGLSGLWLGVLFLASKRNLVLPIVAHGTSNTLAFVLIYLGQYPGVY